VILHMCPMVISDVAIHSASTVWQKVCHAAEMHLKGWYRPHGCHATAGEGIGLLDPLVLPSRPRRALRRQSERHSRLHRRWDSNVAAFSLAMASFPLTVPLATVINTM